MHPVTNPIVSKLTVGCIFDGVNLYTVYSAFLVSLSVFSTDIYLLELYIPFMVFQSMCSSYPIQARTQPRYSSSVHHDNL